MRNCYIIQKKLSIIYFHLIFLQEAYPVKLKQVHVINISPLVDKIVNFVKPFLKEKIRDRVMASLILAVTNNGFFLYVCMEKVARDRRLKKNCIRFSKNLIVKITME